MPEITVYHNTKCSKSKKVLELLEQKGVSHEVVYYLESPPRKDELVRIISLLGIRPVELLRTKDVAYQDMVNLLCEPDDAMAIEWMVEHPSLIERPIIVNGRKAVIGRPPEKVFEILE